MSKNLLRATALVCASMLLGAPALAQDDEALSGSFSFNSDAFFGVNPFASLAYDTGDMDVTFYGIYWGAGTGQDWGNWTEFGVGVGFDMMDGDLYVNPQIGLVQGNLLSSGAAGEGVVGDGWVPNLTMTYGSDDWEGQLYFGWYLPLQELDGGDGVTNEYIHYWLNGGKKFGQYFSAGVHFEELYLDGGVNIDGRVDGYQWLGPYIQIANDTYGMRFSFGADLTDDDDSFSTSDFYKLQVFYNF